MHKPQISVIVPIYNVEDYIEECLKSVANQKCNAKIECILVDDCGTDASAEIARRFMNNYHGNIKFKLVRRSVNGGLSAARNTGIRQARGRYIYLLDSDDLITPECIALLMECAARYPSAEIVAGDFQTFPEPDVHKAISLQGKDFPAFSDDVAWIRSIFLSKFPVTVWNKLISRRFISANNLYFKEGIIHEDNHWHAQAYHAIGAIAFVPRVTYLYRMRAGSITLSEEADTRRLQNMALIYEEMFSAECEWDKPWAKWIQQSLSNLKFSSVFKAQRPAALCHFRRLAKLVAANRSVPLVMRLAFRYWSLPSHRGQDRIFDLLFQRYWKS